MTFYSIDENVLIVANGGSSPQADDACRYATVDLLEKIKKEKVVLLDKDGEVLNRYQKKCSFKGQPGVGDAFFRHLYDNQANESRVRKVHLIAHATKIYSVFPDDAELKKFHTKDRIYVALVLASKEEAASLVNAVDSDYSEHHASLKKHGINVKELCSHCLKGIKKKRVIKKRFTSRRKAK